MWLSKIHIYNFIIDIIIYARELDFLPQIQNLSFKAYGMKIFSEDIHLLAIYIHTYVGVYYVTDNFRLRIHVIPVAQWISALDF